LPPVTRQDAVNLLFIKKKDQYSADMDILQSKYFALFCVIALRRQTILMLAAYRPFEVASTPALVAAI
jgi:hypothetical protein